MSYPINWEERALENALKLPASSVRQTRYHSSELSPSTYLEWFDKDGELLVGFEATGYPNQNVLVVPWPKHQGIKVVYNIREDVLRGNELMFVCPKCSKNFKALWVPLARVERGWACKACHKLISHKSYFRKRFERETTKE